MDTIRNFRAKRELNTIGELQLKPTISLPETFVDIPEKYNYPYIDIKSTQPESEKIQKIKAGNSVYVIRSPDNSSVDFCYVVFKGDYYIVLQVGINKEKPSLVIVSIKSFKKDEKLKTKETEMGVIDTLTLYEVQNVNELDSYNKDNIIAMLLKKNPSISKLSPNDEFFTGDDNTIGRSDAYKHRSIIRHLTDVVNLCIYYGKLYLCIGICDSGHNPMYDLYLYDLNGNRGETFSFQFTGYVRGNFTALDSSNVSLVNNMKFYSISSALSFNPTDSPVRRATFSTGPRPDHTGVYVSESRPQPPKFKSDTGSTNFDGKWEANNAHLGGRRKSKRKYKRTRRSKINKKARKTHTRRIRR